MKTFLAVYTGSENAMTDWHKLDEATCVRASSFEETTKMFLNHHQFSVLPASGLEIMEYMSIPGMG